MFSTGTVLVAVVAYVLGVATGSGVLYALMKKGAQKAQDEIGKL